MHGYNGALHHGCVGYGQGGYCAPQGGYGAMQPPPVGGRRRGGCVMTTELTSQPYVKGAGHVMKPYLRVGQYCNLFS